MKNLKLIPLLAMAALLAGCNMNNASGSAAKSPSFAKQGKQVDFEELNEVLEDYSFFGNWTDPYTLRVPSFEATRKTNSVLSTKVVSKKKTVAGETSNNTASYKVKGDMNNLRIAFEMEQKDVRKEFNEIQEYVVNIDYKENFVEQFNTIKVSEDTTRDFLVKADKLNDVATVEQDFTDTELLDRRHAMEYLAQGYLNSFYMLPEGMYDYLLEYEMADVKEKENFKFFINKKIITIEVHQEVATAEIDASDGLATSVSFTTNDRKFQIDATNGDSYTIKQFHKRVTKVEYRKNSMYDGVSRYIGDVSTTVSTFSDETVMKTKDTNIKEVDISKMNLVNPLV